MVSELAWLQITIPWEKEVEKGQTQLLAWALPIQLSACPLALDKQGSCCVLGPASANIPGGISSCQLATGTFAVPPRAAASTHTSCEDQAPSRFVWGLTSRGGGWRRLQGFRHLGDVGLGIFPGCLACFFSWVRTSCFVS